MSQHAPIFVSQLADASTGFGGGVAMMIVGMGVVFISLVFIGLVAALISRLFRERSARPEAVAKPPEPAEEKPGPDGVTVAVIAAAAAAALQRPVRVKRITMIGRQGPDAWVTGGRSSMLGSHVPRYGR